MFTFRYLTAIYALQRFSAIKNDHLQNTTTDVLKPHQAEVFRIATALQALHSAAPARIQHSVQCARHSDVQRCRRRATGTPPADSHRNELSTSHSRTL